jgi:hypothetical protein
MSHNTSVLPRQREQIANEVGLLTVVDGRCCTGFLHRRGGVEGYDAGNVSLGTFATEELAAAASAATRMARGSPERRPPSRITRSRDEARRLSASALARRPRRLWLPRRELQPIEAAILKACGVVAAVPESKAEGGRAIPEQLEAVAAMEAAGAHRCIAEGLDRALAVLKAWGFLRGRTSGGAP